MANDVKRLSILHLT